MSRLKIIFALLMACAFSGAPAQRFSWNAVREQVFPAKYKNDISFRYTITVYADGKRLPDEELRGMIIKKGQDYLDSNNASLCIRQGDSYADIDFEDKTVTYSNVTRLMKKFRKPASLYPAMSIPDSLLDKADMTVDDKTDPAHVIVSFDFSKAELLIDNLKVWLHVGDLTISAMQYRMTMPENPAAPESDLVYEYRMYDIGQEGKVSLASYLALSKGRPVLTGRVSDFKLKQIQ